MTSTSPIPMSEMFKGFGILTAQAQRDARDALVREGVISGRPNRKGIAANKLPRALEALDRSFIMRCSRGDCKERANARSKSKGASILQVSQEHCAFCGGSADRNALQRLAAALSGAGMSRVAVVGGTDQKERQIRSACPPGIEWRFVEGQTARPDRLYESTRAWADVIVIWANTPLSHKVSRHFEDSGDERVLYVRGTGIASMCEDVIAFVGRRTGPAAL